MQKMNSLSTARAVLDDLAAGKTSKQAAEKHGVSVSWADNLVRDPPIAVRDAPWYRKLRDSAHKHRVKRAGIRVSAGRGR